MERVLGIGVKVLGGKRSDGMKAQSSESREYQMRVIAEAAEHISPPLAPDELLRDADALVELMGREPLAVVAQLADTLTLSAHDAGAWEIEAAASNVRHLASGRGPVVLTRAIHALTEAIARNESLHAA
jgi:hypothetical protein